MTVGISISTRIFESQKKKQAREEFFLVCACAHVGRFEKRMKESLRDSLDGFNGDRKVLKGVWESMGEPRWFFPLLSVGVFASLYKHNLSPPPSPLFFLEVLEAFLPGRF